MAPPPSPRPRPSTSSSTIRIPGFQCISSTLTLLSLLPFLLLLFFSSGCQATPFRNSSLFDGGYLGAYPYQSYYSSDLVSPRLNIRKWDQQCETGYTLFTPRAGSVPDDGPMILDASGSLIWTEKKFGTADNLQIQKFKGQNYLTFWAGNHYVSSWPGVYYMLDSSYEIAYVISPIGFEHGDLHEFTILEDGHAIMTVYDPIPWDLSGLGGKKDGWIFDCLIQEVDIESGRLIFEWRASRFFDPLETYAPLEGGSSKEDAFDWLHVNSIDKLPNGNYLISSRLSCSVACISKDDGSILWELGGRRSSFTDLSGGAASNMTWQHHFRYHGIDPEDPSNNTILVSLFDNAKFQRHPTDAYQSRGLLLSLNLAEMTVTLLQDFINPMRSQSQSQGSMQVLKSDTGSIRDSNVLVGWGYSPAWTMFGPTGNVLCDVHFGAYAMWNLGWAVSYRVFRFDEDEWIAKPAARPDISMHGSTVYASWNGATVVRRWRLQGSERSSADLDENEDYWVSIAELPKDGFEVAFTLDNDEHEHGLGKRHEDGDEKSSFRYFRVQALGADGEVLSTTLPYERHTGMIVSLEFTKLQVLPLIRGK